MIKRVLVGVCQSPAQNDMASLAVAIAQNAGASVTGLAVVDADRIAPVSPAVTGVYSSQIKQRESELAAARDQANVHMAPLRQAVEAAGVPFHEMKLEGDSADVLQDAWRFQDLFLMANRPWPPGERTAMQVTAVLRLIASGVRPVIAVPPGAAAAPKTVMVAMSGSLECAKSMKNLLQMNIWPDASLHLVTSAPVKTGEPAEQLLEHAAAFAQSYGRETSTQIIDRPADRTGALLGAAEEVGAEAIVIGSSYKRFLAVQRFGSHAQELLQRFPGAVFVSH